MHGYVEGDSRPREEEDTKEAPEEDKKEEVTYGIVISLLASGQSVTVDAGGPSQ